MKNKEYTINFATAKCKCGHTISFFIKKKQICSWCGNIVYYDEKEKFKEIIKKTMKKIELNDEK